jgi:hypothetical protein
MIEEQRVQAMVPFESEGQLRFNLQTSPLTATETTCFADRPQGII